MGSFLLTKPRTPQPLRFIAANGKGPANTSPVLVSTGATMERICRLYFSIGSGDLSELLASFFAFFISAGVGVSSCNGYVVNSAALEYNGTSVPITFSGGRSLTVAAGASDIQSDVITPIMFGLSMLAQGTSGYVRLRMTFANPTTDVSPGNGVQNNPDGSHCAYDYDPAKVSITNGVDSTGPITYSLINSGVDGTDIKVSADAMSPMLLGRFIQLDPPSWILIGDSGLVIGDSATSEGATGLGRVAYVNPASPAPAGAVACCNIGCPSGIASDWQNGTPSLINNYLKYFKYAIEEYGGNGFLPSASQAIHTALRAAGVKKIVRTSLTPRTGPNSAPFCPIAISSLTSSGTTATATVADTSKLTSGQTYPISGATPAAYNGSYVITVINATQFTYTFAGGTSPATGTIVADDQFRTSFFQTIDTGSGWGAGGGASTYEAAVQALVAADLVYMDYHTPLSATGNYWLWGNNGTPFFMGGDGLHPSTSGYVNGKCLGIGTITAQGGSYSGSLRDLVASLK